ncbi:MAG: exodeoxyribonuclease VII small subunit [Saprospiraceae bacterium]|jgi:exodeoxyribonuclease VII small subunit
MAKAKFSYQKSVEELQQIINDLDEGAIGIDALSVKIKKAKELLSKCQEKLRATEKEIEEIIG